MNDYAVEVSRKGFDVDDCPDYRLLFSSNFPNLPIAYHGHFDVADIAKNETIFDHNLGFEPVFMVFTNNLSKSTGTANQQDIITGAYIDSYIMCSDPLSRTAQSFIPSITGQLTIIQIRVEQVNTPASHNITVTLVSDDGNKPSTTVLATDTVTIINLPGEAIWYSFDMHVPLVSGTRYWIICDYSGTIAGSDTARLSYDPTNSYSGGKAMRYTVYDPNWFDDDYDICFKAYMVETPTSVISNKCSLNSGSFAVDTTSLKFLSEEGNMFGTMDGHYFIFNRPILLNETSDILMTEETTEITNNDYIVKYSKEGKDVDSTDLRDFNINSECRSFIVHQSEWVAKDGELTFTIDHALGYPPFYLFFFGFDGTDFQSLDNGVSHDSTVDDNFLYITMGGAYSGKAACIIFKDPIL